MNREPNLGDVLREIKDLRSDIKTGQPALLPLREAAVFLGLSPKTLQNRLSDGSFPLKPVRLAGRRVFRRSDLMAFVERLVEVVDK